MRSGMKARVVGTTTVTVPPKAIADYSVDVALPSGLERGNYYLSACTPKGDGDPGAMGCATAAKDVLIGGGIPVRGKEAMKPYLAAKATAHSAAAETCSSGAHTLAKPGDARLARARQRRLPQPPHRHLHGLRRGRQRLHAGQPRRAPAARDAVPDRLQLRLRRQERRHQAATTPGPDLTVGSVTVNGSRRRSGSSSRRTPAIRTARTIPIRSRTAPA